MLLVGVWVPAGGGRGRRRLPKPLKGRRRLLSVVAAEAVVALESEGGATLRRAPARNGHW